MSSLGERIKFAREQKGYLQGELAKLIGEKSSGVISNWERDLNKPDAEKIVRLCNILDVSASFLLDYYGKTSFECTPQEELYIKNYRALDTPGREHVDTVLQWETERIKQLAQAASSASSAPAAKPPLRLIQYYQRLASAGTGQYVFDSIPTEQIEIPDIPEYKKVQFALGVNGLSMEPLYSHGDILLIEPTQEIQPGEIGIFLHNGESFVKELGDCVLHSLNDLYDDIDITEDTRCIGRVIDKLEAPISVPEELGKQLRALLAEKGTTEKRA